MMSAIRSRIFVPVVILIVLFPVLSWALFSSASGWYVKRISSQSLEHLMESSPWRSRCIRGMGTKL